MSHYKLTRSRIIYSIMAMMLIGVGIRGLQINRHSSRRSEWWIVASGQLSLEMVDPGHNRYACSILRKQPFRWIIWEEPFITASDIIVYGVYCDKDQAEAIHEDIFADGKTEGYRFHLLSAPLRKRDGINNAKPKVLFDSASPVHSVVR